MGLHLENEVAVVKTPTIISNNPVFRREVTDGVQEVPQSGYKAAN